MKTTLKNMPNDELFELFEKAVVYEIEYNKRTLHDVVELINAGKPIRKIKFQLKNIRKELRSRLSHWCD